MIKRVLAGVVVDDLDVSGKWYAKVFGRQADSAPMGGLLEWHLTGQGQLQVVAVDSVREILEKPSWGMAGASSLTLVLESLDQQISVLRAAGIEIEATFTTAHSLRTATVCDPSGNLVTFVEELT